MEVVVAVQPSAEKVAVDLRALMVRGEGACDEKQLRARSALMSLAARHRERNAAARGDDVDILRKLLLDFTALHGNDDDDPTMGKKGMTDANQIAVVSRAIRLYGGLPQGITARRKAATAGTKVSEGIFKSHGRNPTNTIGHYCMTFAKSFLAYVDGLTAEPGGHGGPSPLKAAGLDEHASDAWRRLQAMSQRLAAEIDRSAEADKQGALRLSQGGYVERDVEDPILQRLRSDGDIDPEIVIGEAGDGKTTLLWSLHRKLGHDRNPILLSAAWFQPDEYGNQALTADDVVGAVAAIDEVVVLLDTADLLLHSVFSTEQTVTLIERLSSLGVAVVVATRPREAMSLPGDLGRRTDLGAYSEGELAAAVPKLVASYCPDDDAAPSDPSAALKHARARGLVVERVCISPLLLRLLFELAGPKFPRLEVDVTGLYRQYWERRVTADLRSHARGTARGKEADLSTVAGLVGIAMVAAGRPEIKLEAAVRRCADIASHANLRSTAEEIRRAIDTLCHRGVLIETAGSIRFLHQTLFEFAAAQGLAQRGSERELPRLLARLEESPDDLFLGAVVEQLLIVLADDNLSEEAVAAAVRRLSRTKLPSLVEIAMLVWAHHPALPGVTPQDLETVDAQAVERFIRVVPTVHSSADDIIGHLFWIWNEREPLRPKVVDACAYLARRSPKPVGDFVAAVDMFGELAVKHRQMVRTNATPLLLLEAVLSINPEYLRPAVLRLMKRLASDAGGRTAIATCLRLVAAHWTAIGTPEFLAQVEDTVETMQKGSNDSDAKVVRDALAEVVAAHWALSIATLPAQAQPTHWAALVRELCTALEDIRIRTPKMTGSAATDTADGEPEVDTAMRGDQSPVLGARLIAVARIMAAMSGDDPQIGATFDQLFGLTGPAATRQLTRGSVAYLLVNTCAATETAMERLSQCLATRLPADYHAFETGPELWATVARSCLMDSRIPADRVVAVTAEAQQKYPDSTALWTRRDMLLALAPAAIVAGDQDATSVFSRIRDGAIALPDIERNIFLDNAVDRVTQAPDTLAPLMIDLAHTVNRASTVRVLSEFESVRPALRDHASRIDGWITELLNGSNDNQGDGARLLLSLVRTGILQPDFDELVARYKSLTHPEAKADVVRAIGGVTLKTPRNDDAIAFLRTIIRATRHPTPRVEPTPGRRLANPVIVDAARDALLEAFGFQKEPSPLDWDTVFTLTFAPRVSGLRAVEMTGAGNLSLYLTHIADAGHIEDASRFLGEVIDSLAQLPATRQARLGSNRLRVAVGTIVRKAATHDLDALLAKVEVAPPTLSGLLIRAAVRERYADTHETIDRLAEHPKLGHEINKALNLRIRVAGRQTFAEVLSPA
ncbi:hypothetical protein [Mycolicibacterium gilvum]|uniref:hypothetical protein n=1 Tax=Mycolicibacterium gilvum TaxID=1804 RepID=UPI00059F1359|nr:hypothetical protein [Mycolicibacterium gilvum]